MPTSNHALIARFNATRTLSTQIAAHLSDEDASAQSMPDASPIKWHLAHTTWFFETFILSQFEPNFKAHHPLYKMLFNSYYNQIGEQFSRPMRGLITRPSRSEVLLYRAEINQKINHLLINGDVNGDIQQCADLIELGIQHEQQHQELMLTDIKHLLSINPIFPIMIEQSDVTEQNAIIDTQKVNATDLEWVDIDGGLIDIGHAENEFCFDNESPRHQQFIAPFAVANRLVTNGEYLQFVHDQGYSNPQLWLANGWTWITQNKITKPLYWHQDSAQSTWQQFTLHGLQPINLDEPVCHLSYFEAAAFAQWANARLLTEAEWEHAARTNPKLLQLFGHCWQWTSSSYAPYPNFKISAGAVGEYNGKFMVDQYVLRGSSTFTPLGHERLSYRNFFPTSARWQRTGIRLAR